MSTRGTFRLATRGSDLALRQARAVASALEERRYDVELVEVETTGDRIRDELIHRLGKTGAFVRSLDEEVLAGEVDGAVHSMKDMPTEQPDDLVVAGVPARASPGDVLVTPDGRPFEALDEGATVGTSSLRRRAQALSARADLSVEPIRGNVDTRVEKLLAPHRQREHRRRLEAEEEMAGDPDTTAEEGTADEADVAAEEETDAGTGSDPPEGGDADAEGFSRSVDEWFDGLLEIERRALEREVDVEYDGIVFAAAGLERMGLREDLGARDLPRSSFVPAPGQGALAVTAADGTDAADVFHDVLDHPRTRVETTVERIVLAELGAGCIAPIGVHAVIQGEHVHATAQVLSRDGDEVVSGTRDLPVERYVEPARAFAADLADRGATALIDEIREESDGAAPREDE